MVPGSAASEPGFESGIGGSPVAPVGRGPISALVSPVREDRVRPSRANVTAHHAVVDAAHRVAPVLPVRFGTVMPDEAAVGDGLLAPNLDRYSEMLRDLDGKAEYRLKASYAEDVVLREVVERSPAVRRARAESARTDRPANRDRMIRLGELVRNELYRIKDADRRAIIEEVAERVTGLRELAERTEVVAVHAALLVERGRARHMEEAVQSVAGRQAGRMTIELTGPMAPWDFVDIDGDPA